MRTLILNSSNIVEGTNNSVLSYEFVGGNVNIVKGAKVALATLQMYNSIFNITAANKNNTYQYVWFDGITYNVVMPDGAYDIVAINNFLHFTMVQNKHYLESATGDFVYFNTWNINPTRYAVELNCFVLSTAIATANGWVLPAGATWVIPATPVVPNIIIPSATTNNFGLIVGYNAGNYPAVLVPVQSSTYSTDQLFLSAFTPQVSVVASLILTCSLINNNYAVPNNLLYSFSPTGLVGEQFNATPNQYVFIDALPAQYNRFEVSFIDQNYRPVSIKDPNIIIQILISDPGDNLGL
jgi:hypothetical protein